MSVSLGCRFYTSYQLLPKVTAQQATPSLVAPNKEYLLLVYGRVQLISAEFIWAWLQIVRWAQGLLHVSLLFLGGRGHPGCVLPMVRGRYARGQTQLLLLFKVSNVDEIQAAVAHSQADPEVNMLRGSERLGSVIQLAAATKYIFGPHLIKDKGWP